MNEVTIFVRGYFQPGRDAVSRSMMELVDQMCKNGRNASIYCYTLPAGGAETAEWGGVKIESVAPRWRRGKYSTFDRVLFMTKSMAMILLRRRGLQAVVTMEDPTGLGLVNAVTCWAASVRQILYLMDLQSVQYVSLDQGRGLSAALLQLRARIDTVAWQASDTLVVLGDCMVERVTSSIPEARVEMIPIWQDSSRIHEVDASRVRTELGLSDKFVILYSGHASFRAPMQSIIDAAERLAAEESVCFLIVGHGPSVEWLQKEVARRRIHNVIVRAKLEGFSFLETLSAGDVHLAILDERATGTCVPSKAYSAMAVRRPCFYLGEATGQAAMDLLSADAGQIFPTDDPQSLATAIIDLSKDHTRGLRMGNNGHEFFMNERDLEHARTDWDVLLDQH